MNEILDLDNNMFQNGNVFILQKYINKACTTKLVDRTITLENHGQQGICIKIKSSDNSIKQKNIIPFFLQNPLKHTTINFNGKVLNAVFINRQENKPVILTSQNNMIVQIFNNEIQNIIDKTLFCREKFRVWAECMQCQLAKCVYSLQNKKLLQDKIKQQDNSFSEETVIKNKKIASVYLKYLTYMIEYSGLNYNSIKHDYFKIWKDTWEKSNLSLYIKQNHNLIKENLHFFKNVHNNNTSLIRKKNDVDDIHDKFNYIYQKLVIVHSNLTRFKSFTSIGDETKLEVVDNLQQIADLRHHIQTITNNEEEFILIGDQSSGKSSLLCQLLGVNIAYTDQVFATRCPVRYILEPCDPKLGWKYEFEDPETKKYISVSQDDLQKRLINHFKGTIGRMISFEAITIKIKSPVCTSSMTLVDLPGLVGISEEQEKKEQHNNSYALVNEYLSRPNIFILFVHRFDVDIGSLNTQILDTVKRKHKNNVVYCITHFDRYCTDKDITYDQIYSNIMECSREVAGGNHMFLLSLSKKIEDLEEKEESSKESISYLEKEYGTELHNKNIYFNLNSIKNFLRKKIHKHVLEFSKVLDEYINKQKYILNNDYNVKNSIYLTPQIGEIVLDSFLSIFKHKTQRLLKGHLIPMHGTQEKQFFETLAQEVESANKFIQDQQISVWPSIYMLKEKNDTTLPCFEDQIDHSLKRDLVSHALLSRTIYELKIRLCSIEITPSIEDIIHGITFDPNINIDNPKDSAHCVMIYTIQRQLDMDGFFNYAMKRLQYVLYKIIKYVIWTIANSPDTPQECVGLLQKPTFQAIFEIELFNYITNLCNETKKQFIYYFNEITCSPIVMAHAIRYKEMLINDFNWTEEEIDLCCDENIFKPKNIGNYKKTKVEEMKKEDLYRIEKIRDLIKLHIHVRILMMSEHMIMNIDYHWRRMLDDSKESMVHDLNSYNMSIFDHIKQNICKCLKINGKEYPHSCLYDVYNGTNEQKIVIDPEKINDIQKNIEKISGFNEKIPSLLTHAVKIAGNKFL